MPRVTIIIATYNWSAVLRCSIASALRQTFRDFELLVVGDGCTDDSEIVVASCNDPRVRWINLPQNTGHQSGPNNEGLRQARGEIIAYLGHDDLWLPRHLEFMVGALDATGSDLAYGLCMLVPPQGGFTWPCIPEPHQGAFAPPACTAHFRYVTEKLGGWRDWRELKETSPDVELWRRAQAADYKFTFTSRFTAIKFPAGWRRNVYRTRPSHEQEAWLRRIETEPDLEERQLVNFIVGAPVPLGQPYRQLLKHVARQTASRLRRRLSLRSVWLRLRGNQDIETVRRFKGL